MTQNIPLAVLLTVLASVALLQMAALPLAPVTVVQPIGVLAVPWTILLAARSHRRRITAAMWRATALTVGNTAGFAWVAIAHAAPNPVLNDAWLVVGTLTGFGVAGLLALLGSRGPVAWRCLAWSGAAAVIHGAESGVVGHSATSRPWLTSPVFWTLAGSILAGVVYGIAVLGEGSRLTGTAILLMLLFAATAISGAVLLSRRHPAAVPSLSRLAPGHHRKRI